MPGCSGSTTSSPGESREKATRPGPYAMVSTNGMPPNIRRMPPWVGTAMTGVASSFHSITWCSK